MVKFVTIIAHARLAKETCTQVLQQWHIPRKDECDEAVLYEDIKFVKTYDKDTGSNKKAKHAAQLILKLKIQHHCLLRKLNQMM